MPDRAGSVPNRDIRLARLAPVRLLLQLDAARDAEPRLELARDALRERALRLAVLRRRHANEKSKAAVEMALIPEPGLHGDLRDLGTLVQHRLRFREA